MRRNGLRLSLTVLPLALLYSLLAGLAPTVFSSGAVIAKSYDVGTEEASEFKQAETVTSPSPVIPSDMMEDGYQSSVTARFSIEADGKMKVKLLSSSGNPEIDDLTLDTLKKWKFKAATLDGKPVSSTRRIKVEFEVQ